MIISDSFDSVCFVTGFLHALVKQGISCVMCR